ncbi:MAG TPA: twin-arginine translocation signal domain-containing protein, partial [Myxococcaceae bacterium]|nr:twin-arginine translocation signal domain-containing protein [Myxococcaceae bacterium]
MPKYPLIPNRRQLLKATGALAATSALGLPALRGARAAGEGEATYLIEICLRDQLDFGHIFVAPGLAKSANLIRGDSGRKAALFYDSNQLIGLPHDVFLTPQSELLRPHVDTVAMVDLCELSYGPVHGHEASNPVRSPGRTRDSGNGRLLMWESEPGKENGEGASYSSTPTPTALHNYWQKQVDPALKNAVVLKGTQRSGTIYHFGAGLPGSEPDRVQTVESLLEAFPSSAQDLNVLPTADEAEIVTRYLRRLDRHFLTDRRITEQAQGDHGSQIGGARRLLHAGAPRVFN